MRSVGLGWVRSHANTTVAKVVVAGASEVAAGVTSEVAAAGAFGVAGAGAAAEVALRLCRCHWEAHIRLGRAGRDAQSSGLFPVGNHTFGRSGS